MMNQYQICLRKNLASSKESLCRIFFSLVLLQACSIVLSDDQQGYRTAYGCEGETLSITCEDGHVINVIRANYGRFSITICNSHGNTEWSVNCHSPRTFGVLTETCTGKSSCTIEASTSNFGNGCPGTRKYLEAHYQCLSGSTTTTTPRSLPAWLMNTKMPVWFPPSVFTEAPPPIVRSSTLSSSSPIIPTEASTIFLYKNAFSTSRSTIITNRMQQINTTALKVPSMSSSVPPTVVQLATTSFPYQRKNSDKELVDPSNSALITSSSSPASANNMNYGVTWCPPTFSRGIMWNWTEEEHVAQHHCPGGATGTARRKCISGDWNGPPDLSDCRSAWLSALEKRGRPNTQDSALAVAIDLAKVTSSKALYGGDLMAAARLIKQLSSRMMKDVSTMFPEPHQKQALVTEFLVSALGTVSSLLKKGLNGPWGDLAERERRKAVTEIMVGLEEAAFLLANSLAEDTQSALVESYVLVSARSVRADGSQVHFPSPEDRSVDWAFPDSILLPPEVIYENSDGGDTKVVFIAYRHLEDLLIPTNNSVSSRSRGRSASYIVNSRVLSASLGHGRHIQISELAKPVLLTFSLLRHENVSNPICAFWDYTTHDWSDEGCLVLGFNQSHVTCKCDHLTNFAVLMEISSSSASSAMNSSLHLESPVRILTFVGCLVCLVCIAGAILLFSFFKGISTKRIYIHRHVCVCLFIAELTFLIGIWRTDMPIMCSIVAGTLLYSVISVFVWMFAEGIYIYFSVTHLLELDCMTLRWWHYVINYGVPLLIVGVAAFIDPYSFGTANHCWLEMENYFILTLVVPVLILLAMQLVILAFSLFQTCKSNLNGTLKTKEISLLTSTRTWMGSTIIMTILLVLAWILGLLVLHQPSIGMAVAFCTINALLGIFIFIYYCVINQKFVPNLCNENPPPSIIHFTGGTYMIGGSQEGSSTPPASAITHLGIQHHSSLAPENVSYKSFSRDSGHGGSEQEESPRTPWMYPQHRGGCTKTLGHPKLMASEQRGLLPSSWSFSLMPQHHHHQQHHYHQQQQQQHEPVSSPSSTNERRHNIPLSPTWHNGRLHHSYKEIDPVYEEIVGEVPGRTDTIQVSDVSDEDNRNPRMVMQSPGGGISTPHHLGNNNVQFSPVRRGGYNAQSPPRGGLIQQHRSLQHRVLQQHPSPHTQEEEAFLSEERMRSLNNNTSSPQHQLNLSQELVQQQYLSNENLMTVAVLNGEQVVCRLSSPNRQIPSSVEGGPQYSHNLGGYVVTSTTTSSCDSLNKRQYDAI